MTTKGIWISDRQFIRFAEPRVKLTDQIATRDRSIDYMGLNLVLTNPDPILKARGEDIRIYRDLRSDAHVGGCVRRRKSAVKALESGLDRAKAKSRVAKNIESILADLDMDRIVGEILEAVLYGYQPMEITWARAGGLVVPANVESKPPEWFCFDTDNRLRFKTRSRPMEGEEVPPRKFLLPRQEPTYANPYGFPDLSMCFWPLVFKKGGVKFWIGFAEKYGTPWAIGKVPRGTGQGEMDALADRLDAMIQDAVAVIPDDGSVEIIEAAGKSASADLYESLVMYCRSEVSIALTGTNQTVEADVNRASSASGLEVAEDIRDGDAGIVEAAINQLIRWVVEINWGGAEVPVWEMWDQKALDQLRAARDKSVSESGARLTNAYWIRAYDFQEGDLADPAPGPPFEKGGPGEISPAFADPAPPATYTDRAADTLGRTAAPAWEAILGQVRGMVAEAKSLRELADAIQAAFADLDTAELTRVMQLAFTAAELAGMSDVRDESAA
jgi:phage gp29-like protein